jgi:LPS sulfotransferase NodH
MLSVHEPTLVGRLKRDARSYAANLAPQRGLVRFCIMTNARTGSSLLVDLLDSIPHVHCQDEVFQTWRDLPFLYVRGRAGVAAFRGARAYGFKISSMGLAERFLSSSPKGFVTPLLRRLVEDGWTFIFVKRRNLLRQAVSLLRAEARKRYHFTSDDALPEDRFVADIPAMFSVMRNFERHDELLHRLGVPVSLTVWYEDDLESTDRQQATIDAICDELAVPRHPCATRLAKTGRSRLVDIVSNYDDLADVVSRTRYAHFLDD